MRAGELIVRLTKAEGIRGDEAFGFGKADIYATLVLGGEKRKSKVLFDCGSDPVWNEQFNFKIAGYVNFALYHSLKIFLYDKDLDVLGDSRRGTSKIDLTQILEEGKNEIPPKSYPVIYKGQDRGNLELSVSFTPSSIQPTASGGSGRIRLNSDAGVDPTEDRSSMDQLMHKMQALGHHRKRGVARKYRTRSQKLATEEDEGDDDESTSGESETDP